MTCCEESARMDGKSSEMPFRSDISSMSCWRMSIVRTATYVDASLPPILESRLIRLAMILRCSMSWVISRLVNYRVRLYVNIWWSPSVLISELSSKTQDSDNPDLQVQSAQAFRLTCSFEHSWHVIGTLEPSPSLWQQNPKATIHMIVTCSYIFLQGSSPRYRGLLKVRFHTMNSLQAKSEFGIGVHSSYCLSSSKESKIIKRSHYNNNMK